MFFKKKESGQLKECQYVLSNGFRGYKCFPMVVHGQEESMKNNEALKDVDFKGYSIAFRPGKSQTYTNPFYTVNIDKYQVGTIFDAEQVKALNDGMIEAIYAKSEPETVIGVNGTEIRNRIKLFAKYKES